MRNTSNIEINQFLKHVISVSDSQICCKLWNKDLEGPDIQNCTEDVTDILLILADLKDL